ncbi:MAG: hypothetical protein ACOX3T_08445 [Bdellovibrionota bacterium]
MDFLVSEKDKVKLIKKLLDDNECVLIFLNTSNKKLEIPDYLKDAPSTTLQISLLFQGNMFLLDEGIKVSLIFESDYEECFIPWSAIWGAKGEEDSNTNLWLESMPKEIKDTILELGTEIKEILSVNDNNESYKENKEENNKENNKEDKKENKEENKAQTKKKKFSKKATKYSGFSIIK